jgi:hypothetical protein
LNAPDALDRLARIAAGRLTPADMRWLSAGARAFLDASGQAPLEQCLRLPTTPARVRRAKRDAALLQLGEGMSGRPWNDALQLADELEQFATEQWTTWCARRAPPLEASERDQLLFRVLVLTRGRPMGERQIARVLAARRTDTDSA